MNKLTPRSMAVVRADADSKGVKYTQRNSIAEIEALIEASAEQKEIVKSTPSKSPSKQDKKVAAQEALDERCRKGAKLLHQHGVNYEVPAAKMAVQHKRSNEKLIRVRITALNPDGNKNGILLAVGNTETGFSNKYVQFNKPTHIPNIMFKTFQEKTYMSRQTKKGRDGRSEVTSNLVPAFSIVELPPMTAAEKELIAKRQSVQSNMDDA